MDGNVNQEVPIPIEPPAQAAKPETPTPVEPKPAEEQQPSVGSDDTEKLAQQREAIDALKQAGLISEQPQVPPPETPSVEAVKSRQSIITRFFTWLMSFFRRR